MDMLTEILECNGESLFQVCGSLRDQSRLMTKEYKSSCILRLLERLKYLDAYAYRFDVLDAIKELSMGFADRSLPWIVLIEQLKNASCNEEIEMLIACLGNSGNPEFTENIRQYLHFQDEAVRAAAEFAICELQHAAES